MPSFNSCIKNNEFFMPKFQQKPDEVTKITNVTKHFPYVKEIERGVHSSLAIYNFFAVLTFKISFFVDALLFIQ